VHPWQVEDLTFDEVAVYLKHMKDADRKKRADERAAGRKRGR
jgi:hypothetical protein